MKQIITQDPNHKNRLRLTGTVRWVHCDAGFLPKRGYFRLEPVPILGLTASGAWQQFWDVWDLHKPQLKAEGLYVRKEKGAWRIHYRPKGDIQLDETRTYERLWDA